jgi:predicted RNase H-like HicB family nuclease
MKMIDLPPKIRVIIHHDSDDLLWAESPDVPSCFTQGKTIDEIMENMADAILTHLEIDIDPKDSRLDYLQPQAKLEAELRFT